MTTNKEIDIQVLGVEELMKVLTNLEYKTQHKTLKKITNDVARNVFLPPLRNAHPYQVIKDSMGVKSGKSKRNAVSFVGPRMGGTKKQLSEGKGHVGYLANIVEYNKYQDRKTKKGASRGRTPLKGRAGIRIAYKRNMSKAEAYFTVAIRKIIQREWNRFYSIKK